MPNLFSERPVEILRCVLASTSGLIRTETGACRPFATATSESAASSGSDSTLKQRMPRSRPGLGDSGKDDPLARDAGRERTAQFAAGDDVHAGAALRERRKNGLVRIRLHGIADEGIRVGEGGGENVVVPFEGGGGIAIERRPDLVGQRAEVDFLGMENAVAIREVVHRRRFRGSDRG